MTASDRQSHWQTVYLTKGEQQVSWSQADPQPSLRLIESVAPGRDASITDIGGGASRLVDALVAGIAATGWHAYFTTTHAVGAMDSMAQHLADLAAL